MITSDQTAYVGKRLISEKSTRISDMVEIRGKGDIPGYLVTMDL